MGFRMSGVKTLAGNLWEIFLDFVPEKLLQHTKVLIILSDPLGEINRVGGDHLKNFQSKQTNKQTKKMEGGYTVYVYNNRKRRDYFFFFVNRRNEIELFAYAPGRQFSKRSNNILLLFFMTAAGPHIFSVDLLHHAGRCTAHTRTGTGNIPTVYTFTRVWCIYSFKKHQRGKSGQDLVNLAVLFLSRGSGGIYLFPATCTKDLTAPTERKRMRGRRAQVGPREFFREKYKSRKLTFGYHGRIGRRIEKTGGPLYLFYFFPPLFHSIGLKEIVLLADEETGETRPVGASRMQVTGETRLLPRSFIPHLIM